MMASESSPDSLLASLTTHLSGKFLHPTNTWLTAFLASQRPSTPLAVLYSTAAFRLLASDITTTLSAPSNGIFPADIHDPATKSRVLRGPILVQVRDIEDMSLSRWEQIEALEASERGEGTKGREVIRVVAEEDGADGRDVKGAGRGGGGPFKVLLQDAKGATAYGMELKSVEGLSLDMSTGAKMVLTNATVARGMVLLEPACVNMLGGKVETWHKEWKDGRKDRLKDAIEASRTDNGLENRG
jgi:RecQ-mediated genome instability protein 1